VSLPAIDDATATGDLTSDKSADTSTTGSFATLLAETKSASAAGLPGDRTGHDALAQAQPAAFATPAAPGASNAAATSTTLPVPVHSPEFAAAFGLQISGLAQDGVQHAELHLNPAEMGPVSIQITLDGTQARVDFGADVAATRHAIESGLPELASALRDAGFTLAGGGVAQHSGSGGSGDDSSRRGASTAASAAAVASVDAAAQRLTRNVAAGGVDVYA
jgi:flagellar hook-length control protein FliK